MSLNAHVLVIGVSYRHIQPLPSVAADLAGVLRDPSACAYGDGAAARGSRTDAPGGSRSGARRAGPGSACAGSCTSR